jgi:hypothetical protein
MRSLKLAEEVRSMVESFAIFDARPISAPSGVIDSLPQRLRLVGNLRTRQIIGPATRPSGECRFLSSERKPCEACEESTKNDLVEWRCTPFEHHNRPFGHSTAGSLHCPANSRCEAQTSAVEEVTTATRETSPLKKAGSSHDRYTTGIVTGDHNGAAFAAAYEIVTLIARH